MKSSCILDFAAPTTTGSAGFRIVRGWTLVVRSGFLNLSLNADGWGLYETHNKSLYLNHLSSLKSCVTA